MVDAARNTLPDIYLQYRKMVKRVLRQLRKKLEKQVSELGETENATRYRQMADSLLAESSGISRGMTCVTILNVHTQKEEHCTLNPKLGCKENAELLYKKARKAERGGAINREKVAETQNQVATAESLLVNDEEVLQGTVIEGLIERMEAYLRTHAPHEIRGVAEPKQPAEPRVPYRHFVFGEWHVYIGKNDSQNDELTTRFARPSDLWLHVAGHPGSHVVIRKPGKTAQVPPDTLRHAASLAVWFSQAKHTSYAEVHYTEARFVRKRRHAPPGEVVLDRFKSIRVSPQSPHVLFPSKYGIEDE